jgi:hypothetical protein
MGALPGSISRPNPDQLLAIFNDYARVQKENGRYMNVEDFIRKFVDVAYF